MQTSENYIQITQPDNELSYKNSLSTMIKIEGFYLNKIDDYFVTSLNFYQTNQKNEDSKTTPIVLPNVKYYTGNNEYKGYDNNGLYEFYNIFREKNTDVHAKNQQKISYKHNISRDVIKYNSKITFKTEIYNQFFNTEKKLIENDQYHTGTSLRIFQC